MGYRIKDWERFQHFRDRKPPWIKLYRDLLDDPEWHDLPPAAAKTLVMLWLIASEDSGRLPDIRHVAFRLRVSLGQAAQLLNSLSHWLIQDDIAMISTRYQDDTPERETEGETETETERETETETEGACARIATKFVPPTIDQVKAHCPSIDAEAFVAFYESKGWKVGGQSMKCWKSATVTWRKRQESRNADDGKHWATRELEIAQRRLARSQQASGGAA